MAVVNIYATVCISKLLLVAPKRVRTFADLGEFSMGKTGRWLILITQMLTCIMVPIVFLVLGGSILTVLFPKSYEDTTWIILMGISLLPVCLIATLKEGAFAAAAGCLGTVLADGIALYLLVDNMEPVSKGLTTPKPDVGFKQVAGVFGSLALAYGAGIVIPALQREHSEPARMPRVIVVTLGFISVLFLTVAITGVSFVGCQIPGNLLFSIAGSPTALGFTANRGGVILACMFMQLHITIAFAVIINPAFYILEKLILRLHNHDIQEHVLNEAHYDASATPDPAVKPNEDINKALVETHDLDYQTYQQPGVYAKVAALRIVVVAATIVIACVWKDHLSDLLDFTGASCIALCCVILPIVFYLKHFGRQVSNPEWVWAVIAVLVSLFLGGYETYMNAKPLFNPPHASTGPAAWDGVKFSFCPPGSSYQRIAYTNVSYHANFSRVPAL